MVLEARLKIRHHGCFTEDICDGAHMTQVSADRHHGISVLHGTSDAQIDRIMDRMGLNVKEATLIERGERSVVLRALLRGDGVIATIHGFGCTVVWPAIYTKGHEHYSVIVPSRERLRALVERLGDLGEVTLERVTDVRPEALDVAVTVSTLTNRITERQLLILQRAIAEGFYDTPRRTNTARLAKSFGVSRSTLDEHLRKAERGVMQGFAQVLAAHPTLARAAAKRAATAGVAP